MRGAAGKGWAGMEAPSALSSAGSSAGTVPVMIWSSGRGSAAFLSRSPMPLGEASVFYSGPRQGVWFKGAQGTAVNPWAGTVLEDFQVGPGTAVEGYGVWYSRMSRSS